MYFSFRFNSETLEQVLPKMVTSWSIIKKKNQSCKQVYLKKIETWEEKVAIAKKNDLNLGCKCLSIELGCVKHSPVSHPVEFFLSSVSR
ncbi:hypothetical protein BpHYR1_019477 [Brachionus plicatilis]|uniref:Uncharacterized protein n=1 Tax=Brachionus plicatilis TaxID=10195 RepID=A0A3M7RC97_BRAPC|nr:hypothetical protein BpHYR1_019477 [Brachionus plicatilis]